MRLVQGTRLMKFRAVQTFLDTHAGQLPRLRENPARKRFDVLVNEVERYCIDQEATRIGRLSQTRLCQALRRALFREHIAPIVAMAQSVLVPDVCAALVDMPRGNSPVPILLAAASGLGKAVETHERAFIEAGLPDDFLARLRDAIDALGGAYSHRNFLRSSRVGATAGIAHKLRDAQSVVRVLGTLVRAEARTEAPLLTAWHAVAEPRRLLASRTVAGLAAPLPQETHAALPAPSLHLLASGTLSVDSQREPGSRGIATVLEPLGRLFRASRHQDGGRVPPAAEGSDTHVPAAQQSDESMQAGRQHQR